VLLGQSHEEVEQLLQVLRSEGLDGEVVDDEPRPIDINEALNDIVAVAACSQKRTNLGVYWLCNGSSEF
jgi:hypothetical protein